MVFLSNIFIITIEYVTIYLWSEYLNLLPFKINVQKMPPFCRNLNLHGTSPPAAVSLRKLMEEEYILRRQEEQAEARNREATAAAARATPIR